jgi:DNA repair exonuclease SbcCD nuclease subunit
LLIGDWGDGSSNQTATAQAMGTYANSINAQFVVSLGDNFYGDGVESSTDQLWTKYFTNIYSSASLKIPWYAILGNHDVYFKNTNQVNSMRELFHNDFGDGLLEQPTVLEFDGVKIAFVPWITKDNNDECMAFIEKAVKNKVPFLMGHLELTGYEVMRGVKHEDGMDPAIFKDFEAVFSGHFHQKHSRGNVNYLGTPYQITFADLNEPKGFHVFDTDNRTLEYIRNPLTIFTQLIYDDEQEDYTSCDLDRYKHTFVRVVVRKKTNPVMFDTLIDRLTNIGVYGATVIEDKEMGITLTEQVDVAQDTLSIINNEIDQLKVGNPNKLKTILKELYLESLYA